MDYSNNIDYDLFEKKERAKTNLRLFFGFGIIGTIIMVVAMIATAEVSPTESLSYFIQEGGFIPAMIVLVVVGLMLIDAFGGIPIGVRLIFKSGIMPLNLYTLFIMVSIGIFVGAFISPFIVIRDIYYLAKKY